MKNLFVKRLAGQLTKKYEGASFTDFVDEMDSLGVDGLMRLLGELDDDSERLLLSVYLESLKYAGKADELSQVTEMVVDRLLEVVNFEDEYDNTDKIDFLRPADVYAFMENYYGLELKAFQVDNIKTVMSKYPYDRFSEVGQRALREFFERSVESFRFIDEEVESDMVGFLNDNYGCGIDCGVDAKDSYHLDADVLEKRSLSKSKLAEFFRFFPNDVVSVDRGTASSHEVYVLFGRHKFVISRSTVKSGRYFAKFLLDSLIYSVQDSTVTMLREYTYDEYKIVVAALKSFNEKNGKIFKLNNDEPDEKAS
jgi:hypothetical protein